MEDFDLQSQRWAFRHVRWQGFGLVAAALGSLLITLDACYAVAFAVALVPSPFTTVSAGVSVWFSRNFNFIQTLMLSVLLGILAIAEPKIFLKSIDKRVIDEEDRPAFSKRLLTAARALAIYVLVTSAFCTCSYAILMVFGHSL